MNDQIKGYHFIVIPISLVLFLFLLHYIPIGFIPDILNLSQNENISSYLGVIISSLSSITAIFIAILLIAYEFYKNNLKKVYLKYLSQNEYILLLVIIPVTVFLFCSVSLLLIKENSPSTSGETTIAYISILSFIALPGVTFYLSYKLISTLSIDNILEEYLTKIDLDEIFTLNEDGNIRTKNSEDKLHSIVENDNLFITRQLITMQFINENVIQGQQAINEVTELFTNYIIENSISKYDFSFANLQYRFAHFYSTLVKENSDQKLNSNLVRTCVLKNIKNIYKEVNKQNFDISRFTYFRQKVFQKLFDQSDNDQSYDLIVLLKEIVENYLEENMPQEAAVMYLDMNYRAENQEETENETEEELDNKYRERKNWEEIKDSFISYFETNLSKAIHNNDEREFTRNLEELKSVNFPLCWKRLKDEKNKHSIGRWQLEVYDKVLIYYHQAIERNLLFKTAGTDTIGFELYELFEDSRTAAKPILTRYLENLVWLSDKERANYALLCGIHEFPEFATFYAINSLSYLGTAFAKRSKDSELFYFGFENILTALEIIKSRIKTEEHQKYLTLTAKEIKQSYFKKYTNGRSSKCTRRLNKIIKYAS